MLSENDPYIRAINPNLTEMFIKDNKYELNNPTSIYSKNDFTFIEIDNSTNSNKNNINNINNWKYL